MTDMDSWIRTGEKKSAVADVAAGPDGQRQAKEQAEKDKPLADMETGELVGELEAGVSKVQGALGELTAVLEALKSREEG